MLSVSRALGDAYFKTSPKGELHHKVHPLFFYLRLMKIECLSLGYCSSYVCRILGDKERLFSALV